MTPKPMRFRWTVSTLEGKLTLLLATVVVLVVGVITYLANRFSVQAVEREILETSWNAAESIAIQLEERIPDPEELEKLVTEPLNTEHEIEAIGVFRLSPDGELTLLTAAGGMVPDSPERVLAVTERRRVSAKLIHQGSRMWSVAVPIISRGRVLGSVAVWSSLNPADFIIRQNRRRALIATPLSVALLVVLLRLVFIRLVHQPVHDLERAMLLAEAGDLGAESPVVRPDELGLIASRYNSMLGRIRSQVEERERLLARIRRFNEELSEKVAAATLELKEKNRELRRLNEDLYYTQRRLARMERLTLAQQMAARFAHKVGTPLNLISGHIQMLLEAHRGDRALSDKLRLIYSQIEKLTAIVRDMLDETRKPVLNLAPLDLNHLLDRILALVDPILSAHGVEVRKLLSGDSVPILGDESQLEQVFLSLLHNSLDAMAQGGLLTVLTERSAEGVRVRFADTGEGIPESAISQIFRPFFTTKEMGRGTGLGLAIVKEILSAHGATILAESAPGRGTTFIVDFPASPASERRALAS